MEGLSLLESYTLASYKVQTCKINKINSCIIFFTFYNGTYFLKNYQLENKGITMTTDDLETIAYFAQLASEQDTAQSFDWNTVENFTDTRDNEQNEVENK